MNKTVINTAVEAAGPVKATEIVPANGDQVDTDKPYLQVFSVNGGVSVGEEVIANAGYVGRPSTKVRVVLHDGTKRLRNGVKTFVVAGKTYRTSTVRITENGW